MSGINVIARVKMRVVKSGVGVIVGYIKNVW
jgi:hypothetical protein